MKTFIDYFNKNKIQSIIKTNKYGKFWVIPNTENHKLSYIGLGILHNKNGPAVIDDDGIKLWYINGLRHREDGPAIEDNDGNKYWYINNKKHREDGPAIESSNGDIEWYIKGKAIEPTDEMMSKYIRLNPENIFKKYEWPKKIQALAIELGGEKIRLELIKKKLLHPDLYGKLDNLNKRGFFN